MVNLVLFWIFFGFLTSYLARKRERNPRLWFLLGIFLGILGVALVLILPKKQLKKAPVVVSEPTPVITPYMIEKKSDWYYLDAQHQQQGPIAFETLVENCLNKNIQDEAFVWSAGMQEWRRLKEIPELLEKIMPESSTPESSTKAPS